jgi:hypothetical protein
LQGVFEKTWCSAWLFCGEFVVKCVVKAGGLTVTLQSRKFSTFFKFIFGRELQGVIQIKIPQRPVRQRSLFAFFTAWANFLAITSFFCASTLYSLPLLGTVCGARVSFLVLSSAHAGKGRENLKVPRCARLCRISSPDVIVRLPSGPNQPCETLRIYGAPWLANLHKPRISLLYPVSPDVSGAATWAERSIR